MNEGKKLLYSIVEDKISKLSVLDTEPLFTDDINLKELLSLLETDELNFSLVTDNIIDRVINENSIKNKDNFKKNIIQARDLLIGKKDYNLKVELNQEQQAALKTFIKNLNKIINSIDPNIISKDEKLNQIKELKKDLDNNYLLNDFELIESITLDYDKLNFDKNMVIIMKYVNDFNLNLLKIQKKNSPMFDIQMIKKPKLDPRIKEILDKLDISQKDIPNYLLSEIKNSDVEEVVNTYNTLKKNKAENGGILHFIDKNNKLYLLALLLYATSSSIKSIVDSTKTTDGSLDIALLKIIINNIPSAFLVKTNTYFTAKYDNFMKNYQTLKNLEINYYVLIKKCPIFMLVNNDTLEYSLTYLNNEGASKKNIINRCYKTLANDPSLLIDNIEIMKRHGINIEEFFSSSNTNYNLLKIAALDTKLNYLKKNNIEFTDIPNLNKVIISKVYRESTSGYVDWGEE